MIQLEVFFFSRSSVLKAGNVREGNIELGALNCEYTPHCCVATRRRAGAPG